MKAMKSPIPAGMHFLTASGIAVKIFFLRPVTVRRMNTTPSISTSTSAFAYVSPNPTQQV